jgi:hypothetical protein
MIKTPGHISEFTDETQSHYLPSEIDASVLESSYFSGDNSVNKYFYESSNEHVAFKGTVIDWIEYGEELTQDSVV